MVHDGEKVPQDSNLEYASTGDICAKLSAKNRIECEVSADIDQNCQWVPKASVEARCVTRIVAPTMSHMNQLNSETDWIKAHNSGTVYNFVDPCAGKMPNDCDGQEASPGVFCRWNASNDLSQGCTIQTGLVGTALDQATAASAKAQGSQPGHLGPVRRASMLQQTVGPIGKWGWVDCNSFNAGDCVIRRPLSQNTPWLSNISTTLAKKINPGL